MACLYIDIDEVELTKDQANTLFEKLKAVVLVDYPKAEVNINDSSEFDEEKDGDIPRS